MTSTQATRMNRTRIVRRAHATGTTRTVSRIRVAAEVAALLVIALLLVALPILSRQNKTSVSATTFEIIAQPGDTLWALAQSNPLPGMTTAQTVDHIARINGIESSRMPVGSSILVPSADRHLELACN